MNRMRELREEIGISMKEAARQLKMPYTTYVNYEKGFREPNSETLIDIADFFDTSIDYLLFKSNVRHSVDNGAMPNNIIPMPEMRKIPLIGSIACGAPILAIVIVFLLMVMAAVLMYNIESEAQPDAFSNAFDALWWAVATLTTVGYGDIYPVTVLGKFLSAIIALLGIGLVAIPTGIISSGFMECIEKTEDKDDETDDFEYCPHCGKRLK